MLWQAHSFRQQRNQVVPLRQPATSGRHSESGWWPSARGDDLEKPLRPRVLGSNRFLPPSWSNVPVGRSRIVRWNLVPPAEVKPADTWNRKRCSVR